MTLVVDASVALKWLVAEDHQPAAMELLQRRETLIAPDLTCAEVANIPWKKRRAGEITSTQVANASQALQATLGELHARSALAPRALEIAEAIDHPAYDCFYLALAERSRALLATFDTRLRRRLAGSAFDRLLAPTLG